MVDYKSR
ncbi:c7eaab2c-bd66-4737-b037-9f0ea6852382 [Thermothielavioides terrestris]|nr:c7eaab2c-bd66-4737-b037-9f0ea6852382 [Thermothielavioides terrestris]